MVEHNYSNTLLLLHSVFINMFSLVKMVLKREVGGHAFIVMEITLLIIENHGKIMELCFLISVETLRFEFAYVNIDMCGNPIQDSIWVHFVCNYNS